MIDVERRIFYFNTALVGSWTQKTSWLGYHIDSCFSQLIQKFELMKRDGQYISTKCNVLSSVDGKDMNNEREERWLCDSKVGGEVQGLSENRRQLGRINIFFIFFAGECTWCHVLLRWWIWRKWKGTRYEMLPYVFPQSWYISKSIYYLYM